MIDFVAVEVRYALDARQGLELGDRANANDLVQTNRQVPIRHQMH